MTDSHPTDAAKATAKRNSRAQLLSMVKGVCQARSRAAHTAGCISPRKPKPREERERPGSLVGLGPVAAGLGFRAEGPPEPEALASFAGCFEGDLGDDFAEALPVLDLDFVMDP
jgi:hypothetical protein